MFVKYMYLSCSVLTSCSPHAFTKKRTSNFQLIRTSFFDVSDICRRTQNKPNIFRSKSIKYFQVLKNSLLFTPVALLQTICNSTNLKIWSVRSNNLYFPEISDDFFSLQTRNKSKARKMSYILNGFQFLVIHNIAQYQSQ